mgnify:CR=1 FL=1
MSRVLPEASNWLGDHDRYSWDYDSQICKIWEPSRSKQASNKEIVKFMRAYYEYTTITIKIHIRLD